MSITSRPVLVLVALSLAASCGSASTGPSSNTTAETATGRFAIHLNRPLALGARFRVESVTEETRSQSVRVGGSVLDQGVTQTATRLTADVEVLEVGASSQVTHARYRVVSFAVEEGGAAREVLPTGAAVDVWPAPNAAEARAQIDGRDVTPEEREVMSGPFHFTRSASDDDLMYGSREPRAVGESWPVDVAAFVRGLGEHSPIQLDPSQVRGEATLRGRRTLDGTEGLFIGVSIEATGGQMNGMPPNFTTRAVSFGVQMDGFFPLDLGAPQLVADRQMRFEVTGDMVEQGQRAELVVLVERHGTEALRPLH
jgi:hypothetical protein